MPTLEKTKNLNFDRLVDSLPLSKDNLEDGKHYWAIYEGYEGIGENEYEIVKVVDDGDKVKRIGDNLLYSVDDFWRYKPLQMGTDNKLVQAAIADLKRTKERRGGDTSYIGINGKQYTINQLLQEVENGTAIGLDIVEGLVSLTLDLVLRGKRKLVVKGDIGKTNYE